MSVPFDQPPPNVVSEYGVTNTPRPEGTVHVQEGVEAEVEDEDEEEVEAVPVAVQPLPVFASHALAFAPSDHAASFAVQAIDCANKLWFSVPVSMSFSQ
jgi:hypothetical protein